MLAEKRSGMPVSSVPSARLCTCLLLLQLLFFRLSLFLGFAKKTRLFDVFRAMNEWRQPPNLRRSRSICVTKYVKRDPIRRTSLSTDFHKNQCNGSVVETPISQVGFHCFVYSYFFALSSFYGIKMLFSTYKINFLLMQMHIIRFNVSHNKSQLYGVVLAEFSAQLGMKFVN